MFEFRKFCRVCTRAECKLTDLFSIDANDKIKFSAKLAYCIPDVFAENNLLPNLICGNCCENLKVAYTFKKICLKTQRSLLRYVSKYGPNESEVNDLKNISKSNLNNSEEAPILEAYDSQDAPKPEVIDTPKLDTNSSNLIKQETVFENYIQLDELRLEDVFSDIIGKCKPETLPIKPETAILESSGCIKCAKSFLLLGSPICDQCKLDVNDSFRCVECDVSFDDAQSLVAHEQCHMEFVCVICKCVFVRMQHLQVHMRAHTGEKPYKCELCNDSFGWSHHLQRHMKMHCKENLSICTICEEKFDTLEDLQKHVKMHKNKCSPPITTSTPLKSPPNTTKILFNCPKCNKHFSKHSNMLKHLWFHKQTHNNAHNPNTTNALNCEVCNREVRGKTQLAIHMRVHTGERPYSCSVCMKRFTQKGYLTIHMRIHTGEKPYRCEVCGSRFAQTTSLRMHMKMHTDTQSDKCPVCEVVLDNCTLGRHIELMHKWVTDL